VVYATQDINLGDKITASMVEVKALDVSAAEALGGDTFSDVNQVVGKVAGGKIAKGSPLIGSRDLLTAGQIVEGQDLAGGITTGHVAVSLETDQINGVGTLLVPGNHVDVILSVWVDRLSITATDANKTQIQVGGDKDVTTKLIIQNCRVLATLLPPPTTTGGSAATPAPASAAPARPSTALVQNTSRKMIVILEVKPEEAEVINWAQREEKLDPQNSLTLFLALRSDKDDALPEVKTDGVTFKVLVDKWGVLPVDPRGVIPPGLISGVQW
jgi:Flp pilus assembly protein CpaB